MINRRGRMARPAILTEGALRDLQVNNPKKIIRTVENSSAFHRRINPNLKKSKDVRVVRTVSNDFAYPTEASSKYEIELGEPIFDKDALGGDVSFTAYTSPDRYRVAALLAPTQIAEGTLMYARLCHGQWYLINQVDSDTIIFEINDPYLAEAYNDYDGDGRSGSGGIHCDDKQNDAPDNVQVDITWASCGSDLSGTTRVYDILDSFLKEREATELNGKTGMAKLMQNTDGSEEDEDGDPYTSNSCKWVITWIDWFRWVQVVTDVILQAEAIEIQYKNVKVWDDCDLDSSYIPLTDC